MAIARTELLPIAASPGRPATAAGVAGHAVASGGTAVAGEVARLARRVALNALLDAYEAPLFDYLFQMTGSRPDAARLAGDVLARAALDGAPAGARETAVGLFRAATARCLDATRRLPFSFGLPFRPRTARAGGAGALDALPPTQRACVLLRVHHELSYAEIATVLGTSRAAVVALLTAAREAAAGRAGRPA